jgi:deoxyribose-phosphate aldolase
MSLESAFAALLASTTSQPIPEAALRNCLDLTLLDETASPTALRDLQAKAIAQQAAAVCVFDQHVELFDPTRIPIATVINFPTGAQPLDACLASIEKAQSQGVKEIDYVANYKAYQQQDKEQALKSCQAIAELCRSNQLKLKVIVETGAFSSLESLYDFCSDILAIGCDFLKTSTGKIAQGASLIAAFTLLTAIKDSHTACGIKVSGGIRSLETARSYANLAQIIRGEGIDKSWFRIGSSNLA